MANIASARKRARQAVKRNLHNSSLRSRLRTAIKSVRKAILVKYKFDPNKFKVIGNGWDNPVPTMTDASNPEHNKKNRRVEVKVFPLEKE